MKVKGSCHCRKITYEAEVDPEKVNLCNCTDCQVLTGGPYRVGVPAPAATFQLLSGSPKHYIKTADSGTKRKHAFCPDCGAPVYSCAIENPTTYALRIGCLDQRALLAPRREIWRRSQVPWSHDLRNLPGVDAQTG